MKLKIYIFTLVTLAFVFSAANQVLAQVQPRTLQDIQLLLREKESRTPTQRKIESQLLQALRESRGQRMAAGVTLEPAKVNADAKGSLKVDISADVSDALLTRIEALGGKIIYPSFQYHTIRAEITLSMVETIAGYAEVKFIEPAVRSITVGSGIANREVPKPGIKDPKKNSVTPDITDLKSSRPSFAQRAARVRSQLLNYLAKRAISTPTAFTGTINSQGDRTHRADDTRNTYGYAGQGIRIGIISDSYNFLGGAPADVTNGNLPGPGNPLGNLTPVTVVQDLPLNFLPAGSDEGRAMVQIVHDIAPKAQLFFATANISEGSFAANIQTLRGAPNNCDIIIDDVFYYDEPVFQDGIVAQAVNSVTGAGALYFSSAGNEGSVAKNSSGYFEGDFNDIGSPVFTFPGGAKAGTIHNFGTLVTPVNGDIVAAVGNIYNLNWSDPAGASGNDYDLFLVSSTGVVKASSTNIQSGTQNPYEQITPLTLVAGDRLVVFKTVTAQIRAFGINTIRGALTVRSTGQTHGHSAATNAFSVAAAPAAGAFTTGYPTGPFPAAFSTSNQVELFTSDGPRRVFYNPDGSPITPGNFLFSTSGGTVRNKPDITAADGVSTTLSPTSGLNPFFGTSAAAPHAGAIAALLKSANPALTSAQIRTLLITTALDIETPGYDNISGFGIIQAFQAMQALNPTPASSISLGTVTATEGSFKNNNGFIEPGELGNLVVQLTNPSLAAATGVTATLTTSTPGVTIIQGVASYGTIAASGSASNTGTPFVFGTSSAVPCGTIVNFTITVSFGGGGTSPAVFLFTVVLGNQPGPSINGILGNAPPTIPGVISSSGQQLGRLARLTPVSTCAAVKANPGLTVATGSRQYDAYTFTNINTASQCVTVTMTSANGINLYALAYNSAGFVPANPSTNFLADMGASAATQTFSFTAPPAQAFTIVVHDVNVTPTSGSAYNLSVSFANCAVAPVCSPVIITTAAIASGATGAPYTQSFAASGGSGFYTFSLTGALPAGLSFSGNTLAGTPTQAGSFPITITASDAAGCPAGTMNYTLVISGIVPASVTATGGTPQTVLPTSVFPVALQATVRDGSNNTLSGVNVLFVAPAAGASGTFTGGLSTVTVVTNSSGIATAPTFTANGTIGSYTVTASVVGVATPASFSLSNFCPSSFVVTSSGDSGPGTLRDIINNACPGITVTFDPSVTSIVLTTGELLIAKAITISGPGALKLTISGNNLSRIFNIAAGTSTVSISGMTMRDGKPQGGAAGGGAILVNNGASVGVVNLTGCVITNNDVSLAGNPLGGGIDNEGGTVTIDLCSIVNNIATFRGGAVQNQGFGTMTITNSTLAGNTAGTLGIGGAIRSILNLTLTNCTIFGNSAQTAGNVSRSGGIITFKNTMIAGGVLIGTGGTGPDINGAGFTSADYNLIENIATGTITGTTTHNITGVSPNLLVLGNYGGSTPTLLPQPGSPVVNAGDIALVSGTDQRGLPRLVGTQADIGAVEVNYVLTASSGTPQTAGLNTAFATALRATVTESGNPISGITVTFTAPGAGASGTFPGSSLTATAITNAAGIATAPTFTANGTVGTYNVVGSIGALFTPVNYVLTNTSCTIVCPANIIVSNDPNQCGAVVNYPPPATTGACGTVTTSPASGSFFPKGTTTVNATSSSTGATCSFTVTVNDLQVPTITCPANITVNASAGQCSAVVTFAAPTAADNCPGVGVPVSVPASGSSFPKGTTTVTSTVTDASGNIATCTFTVTVNDVQLPTITCPANIVVSNTAGQCGAAVTYAAPVANDNCPGVTVVSSPASGSFFPIGTTTVTSTATDASGNKATCTFTVRVNDTQVPVVTCPANISVNNDLNQCGAVVTFAAPVATDNCPGATVLSSPASGSFFPKGVTTVTSTATDATGNIATCTFTVTVIDTQVPAITTQPVNKTGCAGDNVVFTVVATNAVIYQWQVSTNGGTSFSNITGANTATLTLTGVTIAMNANQYRVIVTGACVPLTSTAVTLTVNPAPVITFINLPSRVCISDTSFLLSASLAGGTWTGIGVRGNRYYPYLTAVNSFTVSYTAINSGGCTSTASTVIKVEECPERHRNLEKDAVTIYPNPNNGKFSIRINSDLYNKLGMRVYTSDGKLIKTQTLEGIVYGGSIPVNLSRFPAGIYQVMLYYAGGSDSKQKTFTIIISTK